MSRSKILILLLSATLLLLCIGGLAYFRNIEQAAENFQTPTITAIDTLCQWPNNAIEPHGAMLPLAAPTSGEPLRILHIGDSHLQAGMFSGRLRSLLSAWTDESALSEGYVFPYNIAKTNSPSTYTFESNAVWTCDKVTKTTSRIDAGLAGISISTNQPNATLSVSLTAYAATRSAFDKVSVLAPPSSNSFEPTIDSLLLLSSERTATGWTFWLRQPVRQLTLTLVQRSEQQTQFTLHGLCLEHSASRLIYSSAGLNGASCRSLLRARNLMAQAAALRPHLIIVSLGTNDAFNTGFSAPTFTAQLDSLLGGLRKAMPNSQVLLALAGDCYMQQQHSNSNILAVNQVILAYAEQHNLATWDFHALMGGVDAMQTWLEQGLASPDMVHLSNKGYRRQAEMLYCALTPMLTPPNK